jgi:sugar lactone lactonase YvrE
MVTPAGIIGTVVGNGTRGDPDGVQATSAGFSEPGSLVCDSAGNLYIASQNIGAIYRLSGGIINRISGTGNGTPADGMPALAAYFFGNGIKIDRNGDIYAADMANNAIRKLILNSMPTAWPESALRWERRRGT